MVGFVRSQTEIDSFVSLPQKLAFMVSLGLVTHDHLEGKRRYSPHPFSRFVPESDVCLNS